eukprot:CAMPEP_0195300376 /NCGR_PEP_ID=MMETSP0707-20130614/27297_1 /TAXON_ID=33640 /ORGANISM="Asterionellopsis glacialis, Strain CCMP134" /LENGTH=339 /DNA_ID=CAMNT_0040363051 /DNA_START=32 /DNA_END=1051 /DNA_ORIENTATION=-
MKFCHFAVLFCVLTGTHGFAPSLPSATCRERRTSLYSSTTDGASVASASTFSGTGAAVVDMNRYNLPLEQIANEWTANLQAASSLQEEGAFLGAKSSKDIFVDTVKIEVPRIQGAGLGIELLEIAGGREDGLGITVVNGLVPGGATDNSGIMEGDSISAIAIKKKTTSNNDGINQKELETSVSVECLGYDGTVDGILSLPPCESDDEILSFTLKRLRRKPKVTLNLQYPPEQGEPDSTIELFSGENLRRAMLTRGVKLNDALSARFDSGGLGDCGAEGTCATCVVGVVQGGELLNDAGIQEKQIFAKNPRYRMACKAIVGYGMQEGEMTIRVNPRQWDN